jgi:hypothetical protein
MEGNLWWMEQPGIWMGRQIELRAQVLEKIKQAGLMEMM